MTSPTADIEAIGVPVDTLTGTAASIAKQADALGYTVTAARALGPRIPKLAGQPVIRQQLTIVTAIHGTIGWKARHTAADGWDVTLRRPGWPDTDSNIDGIRLLMKAQATKSRDDELATRRDVLLKQSHGADPVFAHG